MFFHEVSLSHIHYTENASTQSQCFRKKSEQRHVIYNHNHFAAVTELQHSFAQINTNILSGLAL